MISAVWSNSLEELAERLFAALAGEREDRPAAVLARRHCVVVPGPIQQHWLEHRYLYAEANAPRVLANLDFPLVNIFVNDWLHRMTHPRGDRDPVAHPFSVPSLAWRLYDLLGRPDVVGADTLSPLRRYLDAVPEDEAARFRRRFGLAGRLARLFDEYQVYRPEMLDQWEQGGEREAGDASLRWQPELWRLLTAGAAGEQTYLEAFRRMARRLGRCGVEREYRAVHVFGVSMLPRVYTVFFDVLSDAVPVHMYLFNPCRELWDDALTRREAEARRRRARLEGVADPEALFDVRNPLLGALGRGCRDFLGEITDVTGAQIEDAFRVGPAGTLLGHLQRQILDNAEAAPPPAGDDSLQLHICHGPMREVEVLHDHLLRWFTETPGLQPRHVQVHVSDMATYAPYIEAVFGPASLHAERAVPYVLADRVLAGESAVAEVFRRLLELPESRFGAPDIMSLLQCEHVRRAFGLSERDLELVRELVAAAGVRWGRDARHRSAETEIDFTERTTWRHGLDRLLLGYALTAEHDPGPGRLLPCDRVEGESAEVLGRFARFVDCLEDAAETGSRSLTPRLWAERLEAMIGTFFESTNASYRDLAVLRGAVERFRKSSAAAGLEAALPPGVVRAFVEQQLAEAVGGEDLVRNAVVFSALRPGSSVPRRIVCLLGMGDGLFPRADNRPAYDLFRRRRRRGDRSLRIEDRLACLEALMSASERLYISYAGRTLRENETIPPSTVIGELREALATEHGAPAVAARRHRLQAFHPDYFRLAGPLFSYDAMNCRAARRVAGREPSPAPASEPAAREAPEAARVELDELLRFFGNPARVYFRDVLGARLEVDAGTELADSEAFAPSGLAGYEVNTAVVAALLAGQEPRRVYRELCERGVAPLEHWGRAWFGERWETLSDLLHLELPGAGRLADLLREQAGAEPARLEAAVPGGFMLSGRPARCGVADAVSASVDFRCKKDGAADRLASWLSHLLVCAAGLSERRYSVLGRTRDEAAVAVLPPLAAREAQARLAELLELYRAGQVRVPPFAAATSHAYAKAWHAHRVCGDALLEDAGDPRHARGLRAAAGAWRSDRAHRRYGEDLDIYLRRAFGAAGPQARPGFAGTARQVFEPLLDALERGGVP